MVSRTEVCQGMVNSLRDCHGKGEFYTWMIYNYTWVASCNGERHFPGVSLIGKNFLKEEVSFREQLGQ